MIRDPRPGMQVIMLQMVGVVSRSLCHGLQAVVQHCSSCMRPRTMQTSIKVVLSSPTDVFYDRYVFD